MPNRYTVEIDGKRITLEGDHPPTEDEARASLKEYEANQPSMRERAGSAVSSFLGDLKSGITEHPAETLKGFAQGAGSGMLSFGKRLAGNAAGLAQSVLDPVGTGAAMGKDVGAKLATGTGTKEDLIAGATGVDPREGVPEMGADLATAVMLGGLGGKKFGKPGIFGRTAAREAAANAAKEAAAKIVTPTAMEKGPMPQAQRGVFFGSPSSSTAEKASVIVPSRESTQALRQRAEKGVTNDFKGRAHIERPKPEMTPEDMDLANLETVIKGGAQVDHTPPVTRMEVPEGQPIDPVSAVREEGRFKLPETKVSDEAYDLARQKELERNRPDVSPNLLERRSTARPTIMNSTAGPKSWEGFTRQPTKSLADMVAEHGEEGAAQRSGMSVDELKARMEAGGDPAKLAKLMRERLGAEKAARALGMSEDEVRKMSGGGPSRLPSVAVERIKAAAQQEKEATGKISDKTQALLDRIKSEGGRASNKALFMMGAPVAGAALGGLAPSKNADEAVGNVMAGGAAGLGLAGAAAIPGRWYKGLGNKALGLRRESLLSGLAIPKNMLQMVGNAGWAAAENKSLKPVKELFRLPTNFKEYVDGLKQADPYKYSSLENYGAGAGESKLRFAQPSHHIAAIDKADTAMLKRAGLPEADIPRYMMNADDDVLRVITNSKQIPEELKPTVRFLARAGYPFTRFATNQLIGTGREIAQVAQSVKNMNPNVRMALNIGATGGGAALGSWAGNDPEKRMIATMLLPLFGPGQGLATLGAVGASATSGLGAGSFGGLSPMPETGVNPGQFWDKKQWFGFKPAALNVAKKLTQ